MLLQFLFVFHEVRIFEDHPSEAISFDFLCIAPKFLLPILDIVRFFNFFLGTVETHQSKFVEGLHAI